MQSCKVMRQMPVQAGRAGRRFGEAGPDTASDETGGTLHEHPDTGSAKSMASTGGLLEAALTRQNLQAAWKRVKANKGAAGVDGLDIEQTAQAIRQNWPDIRQELLAGNYRPSPVRKVLIPKPDGSQRELGIPTVLDRLIQQALLQVLQPLIDPTFSKHSHGFRPGRRAHDAVKSARGYVQSGKRVVVDVDLAKFFDRVNHDILIDRLKKRISDAGVIRLIRAYLNAGIMDGGVAVDRHLGTPQGGPLSPLLANVLLDEVDKALEARGLCFARYADDCNVYVSSRRAGERVMVHLRKLYTGLKLQINEAKSAVASAFGRKFLGYELWVAKGKEVKCAVAYKALDNFKARIRQLTRRSGGRSMAQVVEKLRPYLLGWKAYFGMAQTPRVWRELDEWLRHRLRAIQLKHWKRPKAIYRELKVLGASQDVANQVAGNCHRWWCNSDGVIKRVLTIAYFDRLGVPRLS
ncbi:group II intron reverse transcriptase/maturase [Rhodoferax sp.]|uniref:group II intron reverse transcriptase/maturase n=1 Tax=Rhodoferax sp. TaxID=50421 RepID=UPI002730D4BF|nr:group II intron reverse transcriptase/maturase [Rhodoferax sp.]MDP1528137.1 group II intron reverse transcriptase/maturase [Rhodoferax sp.]MDP1943155.1 group II intron reverse transcriptase/maturase [Rhodoferax sp.]MDP2441816.1 group II intron reverse transcriptase/maturase [Rhodoferax sp.]MDP3193559.1 group II intron reverse transcriptase/maturase [Rhodoferax sp.]MDP3336580.1 group II intron reverse transcriptase/maturase [Rhodoferax sp.]